jgi:hypothetical protein
VQKARIAERFDCAVMSTKGMSVTAARQIVDRYAQQGVRILVAHDCDRAGACIAHALGNDTQRYRFEAHPAVIDLGLTLAEARAMGLLDEAAPRSPVCWPTMSRRRQMVTKVPDGPDRDTGCPLTPR